jgi:hypothetical protein
MLNGTYLGKLDAKPVIEGSGDGREMVAHFTNNGVKSHISRWADYGAGKKNIFVETACKEVGGGRKSSRRKSKRKSLKKRRSTRRL